MADDVLKQARKLFDEEKYEECISLLGEDFNADATVDLNRLQATALWKLGRFNKALPMFSAVFRALAERTPFSLFQMARTAVGKAGLAADAARAFWMSCSDPASRKMGDLHRSVLTNPRPEQVEQFRTIAAKIFQDDEQTRIWTEAFGLLLSAICTGQVPPLPHGSAASIRPKLMVSGMGWSGSGALYDFFSEFEEVVPVKDEATYLESPNGFRNIVRCIDDPVKLEEAVLNFFFRVLIGYDYMINSDSFKDFREARRRLQSDDAHAYAEGCRQVAGAMAQLMVIAAKDASHKADGLRDLADTIADRLISLGAPEGRYLLLDNCIHITNIGLAQYLSHTTIYCVMRDPRSNYVALKREYPGFNDSASDYIAQQSKMRPELRQKVAETQRRMDGPGTSRVVLVQFEDFVLSRRFRDRLVDQLVLDRTRQARFSLFRPWESIRNALLHEEYEDQTEIAAIQDALTEHCREPLALQLHEAGERCAPS